MIGYGKLIVFYVRDVSTFRIVVQFDFHYPTISVREALMFHANLRLPMSLTKNQKAERVEKVIHLLGLTQCSSIRVGGDDVKGISGGEKRSKL